MQFTLLSSRLIHALTLCGMILWISASNAADREPANPNATTKTPSASTTEHAPKCYQGCERWGQMCNVDPRGVYKCQRRCEKFGEICE